MSINQTLITVYKEAVTFLENKVGKEVLDQNLDHYREFSAPSLKYIFRRMLESLKNKQGHRNFIGDVEQMKTVLLDFDANLIQQKFGGDWQMLFKEFQQVFGSKYKMDIENKRSAWVIYSKGVLSCADFLANFKTLKDFDTFVRSFFHNEFTIAALPMLLEKEIFGFGFPLACDFLKELGYQEYGKPDIHLRDIFVGLHLVETDSDYEIFKKIVRIGLLVGEPPVIVDKVFWLIGSGNFHSSNVKIPRQKEAFIKHIKQTTLHDEATT